MKLNIGCGPLPLHPQHTEYMKGDSWVLVDKYVEDPTIKKWDATDLPVENNSIETIYASHLLEHFPHVEVASVIEHWYAKLKKGGELIINVPDLEWACKQLIKYEQGFLLSGYYNTFAGEHGLLSIFYGSESHEGEYHKAGFTMNYLTKLLFKAGFEGIDVKKDFEAHEMGVLIGRGKK